jgi:hypothetical protein
MDVPAHILNRREGEQEAWMSRLRLQISRTVLAIQVVASIACGADAQATRREPDPVLRDFLARVDSYMVLHDRLEKEGPPMRQTSDVTETQASQDALAARLQAARAGAKQGDIFEPHIAARFRQLLNPELRGGAAAETRDAIRDEAPVKFDIKVNARFPGGPLPTVPANVLGALPRLPEDLEYRVVDKHLVLRDAHANLIVDYIPDVMCASC